MDTCLNSCEGGLCPLIFTGGSQGAGPATVASIVYRDLEPTVMTFGGVRALYRTSPIDGSICKYVNPQKHYRLVATDPLLRVVDYIPYQWAFFAEHIGHEIWFDGDGFNYLGIDNHIKRNPLIYNIIVHTPWTYESKVLNFFQNTCLADNPSYGWPDGHWCAANEDCESGLCHWGNCHALFGIGERCSHDEECHSRSCNAHVNQCALASGQMPEGMNCRYDADCTTGRCEGIGWIPLMESTCEAQLDIGEECNEDSDCITKICGGTLPWGRRCGPED